MTAVLEARVEHDLDSSPAAQVGERTLPLGERDDLETSASRSIFFVSINAIARRHERGVEANPDVTTSSFWKTLSRGTVTSTEDPDHVTSASAGRLEACRRASRRPRALDHDVHLRPGRSVPSKPSRCAASSRTASCGRPRRAPRPRAPSRSGRRAGPPARPGDEDAVSGRDLRRVEQAVADAGERLAEGGGVLAEPVGDPVQVPRRDDDLAGEGAVDERADRATFRAEVDWSVGHHSQVPQVEK